jgi:RhtB (resistance to homoserine/threonine) family protein
MTWGTYGTYLVLVVLLVLAPGPDTMVLLKNSLAGGTRGGLLAMFGITVGNLVQGTAVALGLGALIVRSEPVFLALRWVGAAYLAYLGFQALRGAWRGEYQTSDDTVVRASGWRRWREGFLSNVTNPKVLAMYLSVLPQFLDATSSTLDAVILAYSVAVLGGIWLLVLMFFVHRVRLWLKRRKVRRSLDAITGTALIGFGVALVADA